MKILAGLAFAAFMMVAPSSAAVYYVIGNCGSFNNPAPNSLISSTWVCPSFASLDVGRTDTLASEFIAYSADFSTPESTAVTTVTNFGFAGVTAQFGADTTTSTCGGGCALGSAGPVSTDGLTSNAGTTTPMGWQTGGFVNPGFYDTVSGFGTPTVTYTNQATQGQALQTTGFAQVIYDYNFTQSSSTPEPISMVLFGGGLLAVSLVGRKKFARK
jgi:hypothetical protein